MKTQLGFSIKLCKKKVLENFGGKFLPIIQYSFVEGGSQTLQNFIEINLFDELIQITNNEIELQEGIKAPQINLRFQTNKTFSTKIFQNFLFAEFY
ncbi:hypothetical protein EOJ36_11875 [Sandaracinomonas limnophila]|uniref:Uncharacterized protein n=1 Tax=Sandaracinomonas limnophila TaxID=1862386 RepID=A0A437PKD3_9BACT|nr:hypothetical protein EOJ36_11875 [Sandaracinomonas limnophila]